MNTRLVLLMLLAAPLAVSGQSKVAVSPTWSRTITVVPDSLSNGRYKLPACTVSIFETDGSTALELLKNEYKAISTNVSGTKPLRAVGCVITTISTTPLLMLAQASTEKKAGLARLTLAFAQNDSTPVENGEGMRNAAHEVAVKLNRAVVQRQIAAQEKVVAGAQKNVQDAQRSAAEHQRRIDKANSEIVAIKANKAKFEAQKAEIEHDVATLEAKYARTNEAKDLDKLNKARRKLAENGTEQAGLLQDEAKQQSIVTKYQGSLTSSTSERSRHSATVETEKELLDALKRKLEAIR